MDIIKVNNLKKYFGNKKAVDDVSFTVEEGDIFGFLGPNGAGKTTTIRCMMDFIHPTSGVIQILEKDSQIDTVELKNLIGYASADSHLYQSWTGEEHISLFSKIKKNGNASSRKLIERFNFDPKIKIRQLSTGNKQKLNIILALIGNPKLLILDEPTQGLDPLLQNEFYKVINEYQKSGGSIFISSHNLTEVEHICNKVGVIKNGQLVAVETLDSLKNKNIHLAKIIFEKEIDIKIFQSENIDILDSNNQTVSMRIKGDINPILKKLNGLKVKDIEISHAGLEEVFLEYYEGRAK